MVFALELAEDFLPFFILYLVMPLFVFFLTYTLALRERDTNLRLREIVQGLARTLFK
jgi:hypothetical protein